MFDYIVRDSSLLPNSSATKLVHSQDSSLRVGIVREEREDANGLIVYIVEVSMNGKQIPVSCTLMTRWGGAHNYEEYKIRPWLNGVPSGALLPASAGEYKARSGDVVVVAYLNGKSKEGVILGGLNHQSRKPKLKKNNIAYISEFNGLETSITNNGSYKVTFKGYLPTNDVALKIPPTGLDVAVPVYNPLTGGSFFGFGDNGSFLASDSQQLIKIHKNIATGSIILKSGSAIIELGGNLVTPSFSVNSFKSVLESTTSASIKSGKDLALESRQVSIKGTQIAIGNDQFELFDGLIQLIDALGSLVVTSPVGTCTPLMVAPTWEAQVLPLKTKLSLIKGSLKAAESFSLAGDNSAKLTGQ